MYKFRLELGRSCCEPKLYLGMQMWNPSDYVMSHPCQTRNNSQSLNLKSLFRWKLCGTVGYLKPRRTSLLQISLPGVGSWSNGKLTKERQRNRGVARRLTKVHMACWKAEGSRETSSCSGACRGGLMGRSTRTEKVNIARRTVLFRRSSPGCRTQGP